MRPDVSLPRVYLHRQPVDFRKSIDGLSAIVEQSMQLSPFSKQLFVFTNRRRNRVKILFWEDNGFCLYYKRLEKRQFHWPLYLKSNVITLNGQQLNWLLDGYNLKQLILPIAQGYTTTT
ncbi:MAG: IS66 family insertion sequence element accessory protein TnpB [Gammaproteobacteria bacterium]|nr:IS66 family insertion sequence element accessory protein TnpB [Gammaproteobacteria bacterium]